MSIINELRRDIAARGGRFTALDFLDKYGRSASKYLSTLEHQGEIKRVGSLNTGANRPARVFRATPSLRKPVGEKPDQAKVDFAETWAKVWPDLFVRRATE